MTSISDSVRPPGIGVAVGRLDAAGAEDYYSFTLGDGQSASLVLSTDHHTAIAELVSAAGVTLARGIAAENADQAILHFVDVTSDGAPEQYFVRVVDSASQAGDEYGLVVTRGVDFEIEPNRLPAAGQAWWAEHASLDESALRAAEMAEASRRTAALQAY